MEFNELLAVAQGNAEEKSKSAPCYQTKYAPPKKQAKPKVLSDNIKRFMARKEEEQRQKELEEKRKKAFLLSLRDHKAHSRINKHLKVCKAANKAAIADAVDNENTAITIAGLSQPDEDDYGYESQSSLLYYNQLMNKYNSLPPERSIFSNNNEKRTVKDIASTKDRVKQALKQQELEETSGERRKRKSSNVKEAESEKTEKNVEKSKEEKNVEKSKEEIKDEKPKVKKKPAVPPMLSFSELLKIAEKKQHEPVVVEVKPKVEEERPMTKRQKKEYIQEKERKEQREKRELESSRTNVTGASGTPNKPQVNKPLKTAEKPMISNSVSSKSSATVGAAVPKKFGENNAEKSIKSTMRNELLEERKKLEAERRQLEEMRRSIEEEKKKLEQSKSKQEDAKSQSSNKVTVKPKPASKPALKDIKPRQFPPVNVKPSLANVKPKQFPPTDLRLVKSKPLVKKPPVSNKRRIYEDEEESDLDGFIDDGPEEDEYSKHISKHISEIFGYDKTKYVDDDDDAAMESNYAQQLREEYVSTKIGIMEDLEDMKMEALEKKRKALMKKKLKK